MLTIVIFQEHELICCEQQYHETNSSRSTTPDLSAIKSESSQNQFLEYFKLCSRERESKVIESNKSEAINTCIATRNSARVRGSINLTKYRTIPFSSPAGIILAKKSKIMTEETQQERLERIERHVLAPPITSSFRPKWLDKEDDHDRWVTTYKSNRDRLINDYVHRYKFSDSLKGKPSEYIINIQFILFKGYGFYKFLLPLALDINSQILYAACRPVCVILRRLSQKQIEESKRNFLKHSSSAIKPLYRKAGPASKTKFKQYETNLMLKSKVSEVPEFEPMIIEEEFMPTTQFQTSITSVNNYSENKFVSEDEIKETVPCSVTQKSIVFIDLCSSDEEEVSSVHTSDENRDPMNSLYKENLLPNLTTNKVCSKACIYPANSTNHWLMQNIFSEDNENHVNKCHIGGVLDTRIQLSPILRPAP